MFCPECCAEYRPGFVRCSDCDVDLVHELVAEREGRDRGLVEVFAGSDPLQISRAASLLEAANVAFLTTRKDGNPVDDVAFGLAFAATGTVVFWVGEADEATARHLLLSVGREAAGLELPEDDLIELEEEDER